MDFACQGKVTLFVINFYFHDCMIILLTYGVTYRIEDDMEDHFFEFIQQEILIPELNIIASHRGKLTELAEKLEKSGMKHAKQRIAELRSGRRKLSFFFLRMLIIGGVMSVDQILRKRPLEKLSPSEQDIVLRLRLEDELVKLLYEAEKDGLDVKQLLKIHLKKK
jgi:hypothetical protein